MNSDLAITRRATIRRWRTNSMQGTAICAAALDFQRRPASTTPNSPEGRAIYFKYIKKGLLDVGVDALWMDGTEVEVGGACHVPSEVEADIKSLGRNAMGDFTPI